MLLPTQLLWRRGQKREGARGLGGGGGVEGWWGVGVGQTEITTVC